MYTLQEIKDILNEERYEEVLQLLDVYINDNPSDDCAYFMRGNLHIKMGDMRKAINDYCQAKELNADSPAHEAYNALQEILNFYNTDLYNP